MFKKIISFLKNLSLTNQLLLILGTIGGCIFIFVVPYIENNVQAIVDKQLFSSIIDQQGQLIALIEGVEDDTYYFSNSLSKDSNLKVSHMFYNARTNESQNLTYFPNDNLYQLQYYVFTPALKEVINNDLKFLQFSQVLSNDQEIYCVISQSEQNDHIYWISFAYNDISSELLATIRSELVNVLYGVILFIALVLSWWIYSMIKPLRQIQNYIRAIKQGHQFNLQISRHDEIGEVGEALIEMETELKHQNQLQSDLIHNISHDLKTPIAIIRSYSECMKDDVYPYGDKNSSLDVIIENADRLEKKVKDFLYLNRLDYLEDKADTHEMVDVGSIASHLIDELAPVNDKIHFVKEIQSAMYLGEYEHWYGALMNILDNALRYAQTMIKVTVDNDKIQIFNDGSYIDETLKTEIFEPYTKGPKGNFGLGMSIVYKIVTMYHCEITADNVDQGVVFEIRKKEI